MWAQETLDQISLPLGKSEHVWKFVTRTLPAVAHRPLLMFLCCGKSCGKECRHFRFLHLWITTSREATFSEEQQDAGHNPSGEEKPETALVWWEICAFLANHRPCTSYCAPLGRAMARHETWSGDRFENSYTLCPGVTRSVWLKYVQSYLHWFRFGIPFYC